MPRCLAEERPRTEVTVQHAGLFRGKSPLSDTLLCYFSNGNRMWYLGHKTSGFLSEKNQGMKHFKMVVASGKVVGKASG